MCRAGHSQRGWAVVCVRVTETALSKLFQKLTFRLVHEVQEGAKLTAHVTIFGQAGNEQLCWRRGWLVRSQRHVHHTIFSAHNVHVPRHCTKARHVSSFSK